MKNASDLPANSNMHGVISSATSKDDLAKLFSFAGWEVRRCSWKDYELTSAFAELILEGEDEVLLHGSVSDVLENVSSIASVLRAGGHAFSLECYASDGSLVGEIIERQNGG
jgi:hypothetical protein